MKRHFFNIAATLSLLLAIASAAMWIRSYHTRDIVNFGRSGGNNHTVQSILGRLHLLSSLSGGRVSSDTFYSSDRLSPQAMWNGGMSGYPTQVVWHFGCVWQTFNEYHTWRNLGAQAFTTQHRVIIVPYRWLTLVFAILPAWRAIQFFRRRRHATPSPLCAACGYDLRATPDRCPECGTLQTVIPPSYTSPGTPGEAG